MYFRLTGLSCMVKGNNSSIYDMKNNIIYLLDHKATELIEFCESNKPIEEFKDYNKNEIKINKFLEQLDEKGVGIFTDSKLHIEKFRFNSPLELQGMIAPMPHYIKTYLEITNECNLDCSYCKNPRYKNWLGCQSCFNESNHLKSDIDYTQLINTFRDLQVGELIIRGGSPLIEYDLIKNIINYCLNEYKMQITIVTNGTECPIDKILELYSIYDKFNMNIVIFNTIGNLNRNNKLDDIVTINQNKLIDELIINKLLFTITIQVNEHNREYAEEIITDVENRWNIKPRVSDVINTEKYERLTHTKNNIKPITSYKYEQEFYVRQQYNTCLYGVFAIDLFGNIKACPSIGEVIGNLKDNTLDKILRSDKLYDFWSFTKNHVNKCDECGMKYFCSDCSLFELEASRNEKLHNTYCPAPLTEGRIDVSNIYFKNEAVKKICLDI